MESPSSVAANTNGSGSGSEIFDMRENDPLAFDFLDEDYAFEPLLTTNKPPTSQEEIAVHGQIDGSSKRLAAIRRKIERLEDKLEDLRSGEEDEKRRNGSYRRILAPIKKIPDEMLGEIFKQLHSFEKGFPLSVSLVCSTWRQVILKTSELWSTIRITPSDNSQQLAQLCLERCGAVGPISVRIEDWEQPTDRIVTFTCLREYKPRIRRLLISVRSIYKPNHPETCVPVIPGECLDKLEELEITLGRDGWTSMQFAYIQEGIKLESLKRLHLFKIGLPPPEIPISLDNLTHLTLHGSDGRRPWDLREALQFLSTHSNLRAFDVANFTEGYNEFPFGNGYSEFTLGIPSRSSAFIHSPTPPPRYPSVESERITHSNLQSLSIDFGAGTVWFLDRLILPNLKDLKLKGPVAWNHAFAGLAGWSSFKLESLTLDRGIPADLEDYGYFDSTKEHLEDRYGELSGGSRSAAREKQVVEALRAAPTIREIMVTNSLFLGNRLIKGLTHLTSADPLLAPNLRHLSVQDKKRIEGSYSVEAEKETILKMFASRKPGGGERGFTTRDGNLALYHSGDPFIPISEFLVSEIINKFQSNDSEISRHLFF